jgi:DNA-binding response OmpR family regulator
MPAILLVDDDHNLTSLLGDYLQNQGYTIYSATDGQKGLRSFFDHKPDLVILDVTMPGTDGWEALKRIRELSAAPVIMLTARNEENDVLRGFALGADDYVSKPFSFAQLAARINAVLSRLGQESETKELLVHRGLQVDLSARRVTRDGETLTLTPTEFKLLVALMRSAGQIVSADDLVKEVWGPQYKEEIGFVRRYIWHLRRKVEPDPEAPQYIHNERGFGYRFGE